MNAGASEVDITPSPGIELSGFLAREQPSVAVLDPLRVKALYLAAAGQRLLWLHADLLGFDRDFVARFRTWAANELGVPTDRILLSATHTHSAPTPYELINCGRRDAAYVEWLLDRMKLAARQAMARPEPVEVVTAVEQLTLAVDRRPRPTPHTDPRISAVGFRRSDGSFLAAILNYAMHPVALGAINRAISADWCGYAAAHAAEILPGRPIVLMTNGAAGNINPPAENISVAEVKVLGETVADAIAPRLANTTMGESQLKVLSAVFEMPLEIWDAQQIDAAAEAQIRATTLPAGWGDRYVNAIRCWQQNRKDELAKGAADSTPQEIQVVRLGPLVFVTAGGEFFSRYAEVIQEASDQAVHIIGYANGNFGYVPTSAAYDGGGYEVDSATFFTIPSARGEALRATRAKRPNLFGSYD